MKKLKYELDSIKSQQSSSENQLKEEVARLQGELESAKSHSASSERQLKEQDENSNQFRKNSKAERKKLQSELDTVVAELTCERNKVANLESQTAVLIAAIESEKKHVSELAHLQNTTQAEIASLQNQLTDKSVEVSVDVASLTSQNSLLKEDLVNTQNELSLVNDHLKIKIQELIAANGDLKELTGRYEEMRGCCSSLETEYSEYKAQVTAAAADQRKEREKERSTVSSVLVAAQPRVPPKIRKSQAGTSLNIANQTRTIIIPVGEDSSGKLISRLNSELALLASELVDVKSSLGNSQNLLESQSAANDLLKLQIIQLETSKSEVEESLSSLKELMQKQNMEYETSLSDLKHSCESALVHSADLSEKILQLQKSLGESQIELSKSKEQSDSDMAAAQKESNTLKYELESSKSEIIKLQSELESTKFSSTSSLSTSAAEMESVKNELSRYQGELDSIKSQQSSSENQLKEEVARLQGELESAKSHSASSCLASTAELEATKNEMNQLQFELGQLRSEQNTSGLTCTKLREELTASQELVQKLEKQVEQVQVDLTEHHNESVQSLQATHNDALNKAAATIDEFSLQISKLEAELFESRESTKSLVDENGVKARIFELQKRMSAELEASDAVLEGVKARVLELELSLSNSQEVLEAVTTERSALKTALEECKADNEAMEESHRSATERTDVLQDQVDSLTSDRARLKETLGKLAERVKSDTISHAAAIEALRAELSNANGQIQEAHAEIIQLQEVVSASASTLSSAAQLEKAAQRAEELQRIEAAANEQIILDLKESQKELNRELIREKSIVQEMEVVGVALKSQLNSAEAKFEEKSIENEKLKVKMTKVLEKLESLKSLASSQAAKISQKQEEFASLSVQLVTVTEALATKEAALEKKTTELVALNDVCNKYRDQLRGLTEQSVSDSERVAELDSAVKRLEADKVMLQYQSNFTLIRFLNLSSFLVPCSLQLSCSLQLTMTEERSQY